MIPLMRKIVVEDKKWISDADFMDLVSLSQTMPGVFAVNMATCVGMRIGGKKGAVSAIVGNVIIPIAILLMLAMFFRHFKGNATIEAIFKGLRPVVVALIATPIFTMAKTASLSWKNLWIPLLTALLIWLWGVSPVWIILAAALGGYLWGKIPRK